MSSRFEYGRYGIPGFPADEVTRARLWQAFLAVSVGDLLTTLYGLQRGAAEANPFVAVALDAYGPLVLVPLKLLFIAVVWVDLKVFPERYGSALLAAGAVYFGGVCLVNVSVLGKLHGLW